MTTPKEKKVVEQKPALSKQQEATLAEAQKKTENDGSHIEKQREARLAQAKKENS